MTDPDMAEILAPAMTRPVPPMRFSVEDIVQRGSNVRRRRRLMTSAAGVAALAVIAALVAWLPGMTSSSEPAATRPSPAKAEAIDELTYLLGVLPLPPGSVATSAEEAVTAVNVPKGRRVHLTRWYSAPLSPDNVRHYLMDHRWWSGSFTAGSGALTPSGWEVTYGQAGQADTDGTWPVVEFTIKPRSNGSIVRVDGWVAEHAYVQRPADTLMPGGLDAVSVGKGEYVNGDPYRSTLTLDVTGARVQALVAALNARPATVDDLACTANYPERMTFRTGAHTIVLTYLAWCGSLRVTVDGARRPPLAAFDASLQKAIAALVPTATG